MSDWQVGDLAICFTKYPVDDGLEVGKIYKVESTQVIRGLLGLNVEGLPPVAWRASLFRKIRPDEHTDCEPEFVELLKRSTAPVERERRILEALFPARDGGSANNLPPSDK